MCWFGSDVPPSAFCFEAVCYQIHVNVQVTSEMCRAKEVMSFPQRPQSPNKGTKIDNLQCLCLSLTPLQTGKSPFHM